MKLTPPKNPNYSATVVSLNTFAPLAGADRIQATIIFGNQVIVGKDAKPGDVGLFFPVECQLSHEFVAVNNLYRKPEWGNADPTARPGFFEESRRVKAVKMRGHKSEGFFIPISSLSFLMSAEEAYKIGPPVGSEFDTLDGVEIVRKYVAKTNKGPAGERKDRTVLRKEDTIIPGQFHFHIDTENLRRNVHKLTPDSWISISDKWHGTSVIVSNLLVRKTPTFFGRIAKFLGIPVVESSYSPIWASRRVVKGVDTPKDNSQHFYSEDIWGIVAAELFALRAVEKGITIYAEIVGFTPSGSAIQSGYSYGCVPGTHRTLVYRITSTNEDGKIIEFSWNQIKAYTTKYGLEMVKELYYGKADHWSNSIDQGFYAHDTWNEQFLQDLERIYVSDQDCPYNPPGTPAEGIVLKVDRLDYDEAYKLKNFRFLEHETKILDKGETNIEDEQVVESAV